MNEMNIKISDHLPVYIHKKKEKIKQTHTRTRGRTYKHYIQHDFENIILNDNRWIKFWDPDLSVDEIWQCMFDIILTAADEICPMVNMKIRNGNPEWFSKEKLEEIYLKDELFRQFNITKKHDDWMNFKTQNNFAVIMLGPRSAQFAHKNGKSRIVLVKNAQIAHPFFSSMIHLYRKMRI